jgi:hypothetical protein
MLLKSLGKLHPKIDSLQDPNGLGVYRCKMSVAYFLRSKIRCLHLQRCRFQMDEQLLASDEKNCNQVNTGFGVSQSNDDLYNINYGGQSVRTWPRAFWTAFPQNTCTVRSNSFRFAACGILSIGINTTLAWTNTTPSLMNNTTMKIDHGIATCPPPRRHCVAMPTRPFQP